MGLEVGRFIISVARHKKTAKYDFLYVSHYIKQKLLYQCMVKTRLFLFYIKSDKCTNNY